MSSAPSLSQAEFEEKVLKSDRPVLVDFGQSGSHVKHYHRFLMR